MTSFYKNIVLIDDDPINNLINKKILQKFREDLMITIFQEATNALHFLKSEVIQQPDIIFLDINMPVMNGWEFLEEYKKLGLLIPVVMLTSSIDQEDISKSQTYDEVKDYYIKPLKKERLVQLFA